MLLLANTELQNGKYRIVRVIGQGGFGITYLAENIYFNKFVAIKEFFPKEFCGRDNTSHVTLGTVNNAETVAKLKARFLKEAQNIAKLDHTGIVKIHDIFEENETAYYVMDYINGENLNEMVKRNGPLPESKALEYIRKVADALDYIHSRNMTHFDVKPANIVVRKSDNMPILIDFGLSKQYDRSGDATSTMMQGVSQGYSPIELYYSGQITSFSPKTDVYSLGATFYYLVTGSIPPPASQVLEEGLNLPTNISEANQSAIKKAMSASRTNRPQSISAFLNLIHTQRITTTHSFTNNTSSGEETIFINPQSESSKPAPNPEVPKPKPTPTPEPIPENTSYGKKIIWIIIILFVVVLIIFNRNTDSTQLQETVKAVESNEGMTSRKHSVTNVMIQTTLGNAIYSGEIDENGLPHGKGVANWEKGDGVQYDGEWVHGNMEGQTTYTQRSGDTFVGTFKDNHYQRGRYIIKDDGSYFDGTFKNGQPDKGAWYDKFDRIL